MWIKSDERLYIPSYEMDLYLRTTVTMAAEGTTERRARMVARVMVVSQAAPHEDCITYIKLTLAKLTRLTSTWMKDPRKADKRVDT